MNPFLTKFSNRLDQNIIRAKIRYYYVSIYGSYKGYKRKMPPSDQ